MDHRTLHRDTGKLESSVVRPLTGNRSKILTELGGGTKGSPYLSSLHLWEILTVLSRRTSTTDSSVGFIIKSLWTILPADYRTRTLSGPDQWPGSRSESLGVIPGRSQNEELDVTKFCGLFPVESLKCETTQRSHCRPCLTFIPSFFLVHSVLSLRLHETFEVSRIHVDYLNWISRRKLGCCTYVRNKGKVSVSSLNWWF